ncbi:MAG TPA: methylated-DNA--[protein]-cysteine S-methyltransferase [Mycobacterium sp.]|nr:methylated-DNA--[protein]-cysteine S-methyltransferase [Mycobacterium sp.]
MITNLFRELPDEAGVLQNLHTRLERDADAHDLLDIAYRTIDTPVGELLLAATPIGLVRVAYTAYSAGNHAAVLAGLAEAISPRILRAPARLDTAVRQIDEYFAGRRRGFTVPVDLRLATGFRRSVVEHLRAIGYGQRESYATVAAAVGNPRAVRAVGSACAHNPLPVVIGCHRVVRSDGSIGRYAGGGPAKATLLDLEAG